MSPASQICSLLNLNLSGGGQNGFFKKGGKGEMDTGAK